MSGVDFSFGGAQQFHQSTGPGPDEYLSVRRSNRWQIASRYYGMQCNLQTRTNGRQMFSLRTKNRVNKRFPSSKRLPRGLMRLELLLVLSVILLNVAIFLPFVQVAREAARRDQCKHNLKQVGLAMANYVDAYECFPAGFDVSPQGSYSGWGWNLRILPYMDAADLYNTIEPRLAEGIHGLPDTPQFSRRLTTLWCPSDTGTETVPHAMVVTAKVVD